jgi:EmrB/QacA subfamily drug resistance transporter
VTTTDRASGPPGPPQLPDQHSALSDWDRTTRAYQLRWATLGVLCVSLLIIVVDNSILNVAIPTLVRDLKATNSDLQWMVDSYSLVFACLLLTAGALGDRYGRRGALQVGFSVFGFGSLLSAFATSPSQLIGTRAVMGIGAAFIMPATLSIISNTFPPEERGRAIGMWAGIAGVAGALGPISGGFLLEHFYWGSIFLVNIPIVIFALVSSMLIIPTSKDPSKPRQDPVGAILSIIGLSALTYGIIQGGNADVGWTDARTLAGFAVGFVVLGLFAVWESRVDEPMLDTSFFTNPRFSAASGGITAVFFAMFGATFILTQYLQFVLGFSPLKAGVGLLPWAMVMMVVAPSSSRFVERFGTKLVVGGGLTMVAVALTLMTTLSATDGYGQLVWRMMLMAAGMGLVMAPATESIMGSLPRAKAGVGSAVNDTTRQTGGLLGVAVIGSVFASVYASRVGAAVRGTSINAQVADNAKRSIGDALAIAQRLHLTTFERAAKDAFVAGMHRGMLVAVLAAGIGAVVAFMFLPARATEPDR